ncbi:MAG: hypothetical protein Q7V58_04320 [Actinomycetota bacterium]|nr:hypothetical protein [Actinomycetota bacterium]
MPEQQIPDSPDEFAEVRAALADLDFLRPDGSLADPGAPAMPDDVWARLDHALAMEAATRAAETHDNVVVLSHPRRRWAGGLVAAAMTVVAVGAAVVVVQGAATQSIVATEATKQVAAAEGPAALAEAPAEGGTEDLAAAAPAPATSAVVPASRIVMASNTDYTQDGLRGQVSTMVKERFATPEDAYADVAVPVELPVVGGFTQSWEALRDCLESLTRSSTIQALVVDRGTFNGSAAGVIVAPEEAAAGLFDVWVVNEDCEQLMAPLENFALYEWTP